MPDYRKMYAKMMASCEQAIQLLITAQQECEELYVSAPEGELRMLARPTRREKDAHDAKKAGYRNPAAPQK